MVGPSEITAWASRTTARWQFLAGTNFFRVHPACYPANAFNPNLGASEGRFHPIYNASSNSVPTLYASSSIEGAFGEVLFRHGVKNLPLKRTEQYCLSEVELKRDVVLFSLKGVGLRSLGLSRSDILESTDYAESQALAKVMYNTINLNGLVWLSKQNDMAQNVVFFEAGVTEADLKVIKTISLETVEGRQLLFAAANDYNINIII